MVVPASQQTWTNALALVIGKCLIVDEDMTTKKNWDDTVGNFENAFDEFDLNLGDHEAPLKTYLSQNNH